MKKSFFIFSTLFISLFSIFLFSQKSEAQTKVCPPYLAWPGKWTSRNVPMASNSQFLLTNSPINIYGPNVGIGTTDPRTPLDVNGNITLRGNYLTFDVGQDISHKFGYIVNSTTSAGIVFLIGENIYAGRFNKLGLYMYDKYVYGAGGFIVQSGGERWDAVYQALDRAGEIHRPFHLIGTYHGWDPFGVYIAGYNFYNSSTVSQAKKVYVGGSGTERMTIDLETGNVGIGTTSPMTPLDVNGIIMARKGIKSEDDIISSKYVRGLKGLCIGIDCRDRWPIGGIGGSGTTNYVAKFTDGGRIGNSIIYENNGNVGIGTTAPREKLEVAGDVKANDLIFANKRLSECHICFKWEADGKSGQCNSVPWDGTSEGSGTVCAPIDSWTPKYRDDTDDRGGGCRLQWKLDCTPPYGD